MVLQDTCRPTECQELANDFLSSGDTNSFYSCGLRNVFVVGLSVTAMHVHYEYNAHSGICIDNREYIDMEFFSSK